jgi:hypothetical protein
LALALPLCARYTIAAAADAAAVTRASIAFVKSAKIQLVITCIGFSDRSCTYYIMGWADWRCDARSVAVYYAEREELYHVSYRIKENQHQPTVLRPARHDVHDGQRYGQDQVRGNDRIHHHEEPVNANKTMYARTVLTKQTQSSSWWTG